MVGIFSRIASAIRPGPPAPPPPARDSDLIERGVDASNLLSSGLYRNQLGPRKGADEIIALYRESPWLRAVSHKVASAVARTEWKIYARRDPATTREEPHYVDDETGLARLPRDQRRAAIARAVAHNEMDEITNHPAGRLLARPNMTMTGFAARMITSVHLDLVGESFWILDVNEQGMPVRAWPIPPTWIATTPTPAEPFYRLRFADFAGIVPFDRVMWFRDIDPGEPYGRGVGLGLALADELDIDEHAAKTVSSWFQNFGMPSMLVQLKGAGQAATERARLKWDKALKGFRKAYQTYFTGAEIKVERLDTTFQDMALVDIRKAQRDTILSVWGVPPEKLAVITSSNRATIEAADLIFTKDVVLPRLEAMRQDFQLKLLPRFDQRLIIDFVDPVPEDRDRRMTQAQSTPQFMSIDEHREVVGLPPLENGKGSGFLMPNGLTYVDSPDKFAAPNLFGFHLAAGLLTVNEARYVMGMRPTTLPWGNDRTVAFYTSPLGGSPGASAALEKDPNAAPSQNPADAAQAAQDNATAQNAVDTGASTDDAAKAVEDAAKTEGASPEEAKARGESAIARITQRAIKHGRQPDTVLPVTKPSPAAVTKAWLTMGQIRALVNGVNAGDVGESVDPVVKALVESWGEETITSIDDSLTFDTNSGEVDTFLKGYTEQRIGELVNETTKDEVRSAIESWDGNDPEDLVGEVRDVFDRARVTRSQTISATEGTYISGFASTQAMRQSGIVEEKEWVAVGDGRTREAHLSMDGQTVDVDAPFEVKSGQWTGSQAQSPGSFGIAALDANCRCASAPIVTPTGATDAIDETTSLAAMNRYTRGGVLPRGASLEVRAAVWKAHDSKLRKWEARLSDAYVDGFDRQERKTIETLRKMIG